MFPSLLWDLVDIVARRRIRIFQIGIEADQRRRLSSLEDVYVGNLIEFSSTSMYST